MESLPALGSGRGVGQNDIPTRGAVGSAWARVGEEPGGRGEAGLRAECSGFPFRLNYSLGMDRASVCLRTGAGWRESVFLGRDGHGAWIIGALCYWLLSPWDVGVWVGTWDMVHPWDGWHLLCPASSPPSPTPTPAQVWRETWPSLWISWGPG